jgi:hypothetical protein
MNKKERMYKAIEAHGENLKRVFGLPPETDPFDLCRKLRRLEAKAERVMLAYCNANPAPYPDLEGTDGRIDGDKLDTWTDALRDKVAAIIGKQRAGDIKINRDPRGYALKLHTGPSEKLTGIYKDWGGYVILAPDFSEGN